MVRGPAAFAGERPRQVRPHRRVLEYPFLVIGHAVRLALNEIVVVSGMTAQRGDDMGAGRLVELLPGDGGDDLVGQAIVGVGRCRSGQQGQCQ